MPANEPIAPIGPARMKSAAYGPACGRRDAGDEVDQASGQAARLLIGVISDEGDGP